MRLNNPWAVALSVFLTIGCSVTYRAKMVAIPPDSEINNFQAEGEAVSIRNGAREGAASIGKTIPGGGEGYLAGEPDIIHFSTDLKQVTDVTASLLAEELSKRGFLVRKDASKSITLKITEIDLIYTYPFHNCFVKMEYTTSDGHSGTVSVIQLSDDYYAAACNGAIAKGVVDLLNDDELIDYLKRKE